MCKVQKSELLKGAVNVLFYNHFQTTVNGKLFSVLFHATNIQVCPDKLLRFLNEPIKVSRALHIKFWQLRLNGSAHETQVCQVFCN